MHDNWIGEIRSVDRGRASGAAPVHDPQAPSPAAARASGRVDSHPSGARSHADMYAPSAEVASEMGPSRERKPRAPERVGPDHPWSNGYSLEGTTNAHRTNTPEEMEKALRGDADWLEGDVRMGQDGRPVMAHDKDAEGLSLQEWLEIGGESGRGLKIEIKEPEHTREVLEEARRSGVPGDRLMFNLSAGEMEKWGPEIRRQFPDAILAMSVPGGELTPEKLDRVMAQADGLDGRRDGHYDSRLAFVLKETQVSDEALRRLEPVAPISVWNDPGVALPFDTPPSQRIQDLKDRGVTGVIDIRKDDSVLTKGKDLAKKAWHKIADLF